jgi:predicted PhzF superfamily epimerase YddE/YHI9
MTTLAFQQVDVFTAVPFKGNPVAVVLDGDAVSSADMQSIAAWTNLSETTFVCTATDQRADYRLRIFTPKRELPFAGHPTIGSAHAVLRHGLKPRAAALVRREGLLKTQTYVASQGRCLGRDGQVTVQFDAGTIWLGGHAVTCVEGALKT